MPLKDPEARKAYQAALYQTQRPERLLAVAVYRVANVEKIREAKKVYRATHVESIRDRMTAWYAANRDEQLVKRHAFYLAHVEEISEQGVLYRVKYKEAIRERKIAYAILHKDALHAYMTIWRAAHPEIIHAYHAKRRALKASAPVNDLSAAQWREIVSAYESRCAYCQRKMARLTQDHITPLTKGGSHTATNIVPACKSCNSRKKDRAPLCPVQPLLFTVASARRVA